MHGDVLTFERSFQSERAFCAFNLSDHSVEVSVPQNGWHMFGDEVGAASNLTNGPRRTQTMADIFLPEKVIRWGGIDGRYQAY